MKISRQQCGAWVWAGLLALWLLAGPAWGQSGSADVVQMRTQWSADAAKPGDSRILAVHFKLKDGWHIYGDPPQVAQFTDFSLIATQVEVVDKSPGWVFEKAVYPATKGIKVTASEQLVPVFEHEFAAYLKVKIDAPLPPGVQRLQAQVKVRFQACDEERCLFPSTITLPVELQVADTGAAAAMENAEVLEGYRKLSGEGTGAETSPSGRADRGGRGVKLGAFGWDYEIDPAGLAGYAALLAFAALGGLLLNFTPCVLPLIPLKVMGLAQHAGGRGRMFFLGLVMSAGVVAFWLGLGLAVSGFSFLATTNELFQKPWFTVGTGVVIAVMAVGMCGLFTWQPPNWVYRFNPKQDSALGSFGFGVMTSVLSTPCTAPFMGGALAWAVTQTVATSLTVFVAIGAGMALPYALLTAFPNLVKALPRGGPAGELLKQTMGLLMLGAAAYFIGAGLSGYLVTPPDPPTRLYWWAVAGAVMLAGGWLGYRGMRLAAKGTSRAGFALAGILLVAAGLHVGFRFTDKGPIDWVHYTPQRLAAAQQAGQVVVLEFTAEWCLNCKALEQTVLQQAEVVKSLGQPGVLPMKVDLTGGNPSGALVQKKTGRETIPWLVVMNPRGEIVFASEAYTAAQVLAAVDQARKG